MLKTKKKRIASGLFFAAMFSVTVFSCKKTEELPQDNMDVVLSSQFSEYELVTLDEKAILDMHQDRTSFDFDLKLESHKDWKFDMVKYHSKTDDFALYLVDGNNNLTPVDFKSYEYEGFTADNSTQALFIFEDNHFSGDVFEGDNEYMIEPVREYFADADKNLYIVYNVKNTLSIPESCGMENEIESEIKNQSNSNSSAEASNCWAVELSYLGDFQIYRDKFGSNWSNCVSWMNARVTNASYRYMYYNNYPVAILKKKGYLYTSDVTVASTTTGSTAFLGEWKAFGNNNTSWYNRGDVNMLFTGLNVSGSAGAAYRSTVCKASNGSRAYAFLEKTGTTSWGNNATAHEVGHTLGATHVSTGFMKSNSSQSSMNSSTRTQLGNHIGSYNSCLGSTPCTYYHY